MSNSVMGGTSSRSSPIFVMISLVVKTMASTNRKIAKISAFLMLIGIIGNTFSMLKEMLVARAFGLSSNMDAYYAALTIPSFTGAIFGMLLSSIFIPLYVGSNSEGRDRTASSVINWTAALALLAIVPMFAAPSLLISLVFHGLQPGSASMAGTLLQQLSWTILLSVTAGLLTGILNAKEKFVAPAASTMAVTFCTVALILYFPRRLGIEALSLGMIAGMLFQTLFLMRELKAAGFKYHLTMSLEHPEMKDMLRSSAAFMAAVLLNQLTFFASQLMASWLPQGSMTAMGYSAKLLQIPMTVYTGAIVTAVFPYFARQVAEGDMKSLAHSTARSIRMTAFVFIPFTLLNAVFAHPCIELLFQRGKFDAAATNLVSLTFVLYAIQLFFNTSGMILSRIYFALKEFRFFIRINAILLIINLCLGLGLMRIVNPPVAGLALANSLFYASAFWLIFRNLKKRLPELDGKYILDGALRSAAAGGMAAAVAALALHLSSPLPLIPRLLVSIPLSALTLVTMAHILGIDEYRSIVLIIREKLGKPPAENAERAQG